MIIAGDYDRLVLSRWDQGAGALPELKAYGAVPLSSLIECLFGTQGVYEPD